MMNRRGFLTGLAAAIAAPAVVRSGILMPLRGIVMPVQPSGVGSIWLSDTQWYRAAWDGDLVAYSIIDAGEIYEQGVGVYCGGQVIHRMPIHRVPC